MISPTLFEKYELTAEHLRPKFEAEQKSEKVGYLIDMIKNRIRDGRSKNLQDWRIHAAIDLAYDAPYNQTTPTLMQHYIDNCQNKDHSYEETLEAVKGWGLDPDSLFTRELDEKSRQPKLVPNFPTFYKVLVPLVKAYVTIRLSKLFTDRNQLPLFKYEPLKMTQANQVKCEVITDIASAMSTHYGYSSELRNAIFKTLLYSVCIMFPRESWHVEEQEGMDGEDYTVKEGLRYFQPHPSRMFYDLMNPLSSINTDTGCEYAGYWSILRYGEVHRSDDYWNKGRISYGTDWFRFGKGSKQYFSEVYPCVAKFPHAGQSRESDREERATEYGSDDMDAALFVTYIFQKIVPKEWGLGDYEHPIWFRFVMASDETVLFAEPLSYNPLVYFGCDADDLRDRNPSLGLELIPWQDNVGNVLSQILLTAKQNLANVTFVDENMVDQADIRKLQNAGQSMFTGLNIIGFDGQKNVRGANNVGDAFRTVQLAKSPTGELVNSLTTIIGVMERLIQFSAQEVGSAASHQQSAQEIRTINANTTTRVAYTGAFIDDAVDAWKKQIYEASIAYMDRDFVAEVSTEIPNLDRVLNELGFVQVGSNGTTVLVEANLDQLMLEGFASTKDGPDRGLDAPTAAVMMQTLQQVLGIPGVAEKLGTDRILKMVTRAAHLAGAPKDFSLEASKLGPAPSAEAGAQPPEGGPQQPGGPAPTGNESVMAEVEERIAKPAAEAIQAQGEQINELRQVISQIASQFTAAESAPPLQPPTIIDTSATTPVAIP